MNNNDLYKGIATYLYSRWLPVMLILYNGCDCGVLITKEGKEGGELH